jgi:hypothetical protein
MSLYAKQEMKGTIPTRMLTWSLLTRYQSSILVTCRDSAKNCIVSSTTFLSFQDLFGGGGV